MTRAPPSVFGPDPEKDSPNPTIDTALTKLMSKLDDKEFPPDTAVKIVNAAIAWEKVKHHIKDEDEGFNPDNLM